MVINPAVPLRVGGSEDTEVRHRGMYAIMEQAGHITSVRILELGLAELRLRRPEIEVHLLQPDAAQSPLMGPSMGFEASRAALRFGYASIKDYIFGEAAAPLRRRFGTAPRRATIRAHLRRHGALARTLNVQRVRLALPAIGRRLAAGPFSSLYARFSDGPLARALSAGHAAPIDCGFGDPQKPRPRWEGPLVPPGAVNE